MYRILYFLALIILPVMLSWWLFIPMALVFIYLAKLPYEMIAAGFILDTVYYFGDGFLWEHLLSIFSLVLIIVAFFLAKTLSWRKVI